MARKVQVLLVDDLDGGAADETVSFALDGASYEIDLSSDNAKKLRDSLSSFVEHAQKASGGKRRGAASRTRGTSSRERSAEIRAWAKSHGKKVNERGRIPASIVEEFEAATGR